MNCKMCGKEIEIGHTLCEKCENKEQSTIQKIVLNGNELENNGKILNKKSVSDIIGKILLIGTLGLLPIHLLIWAMMGISHAEAGGDDLSGYYALTVLIIAFIGLFLKKKKTKTLILILLPLIVTLLLIVGLYM